MNLGVARFRSPANTHAIYRDRLKAEAPFHTINPITFGGFVSVAVIGKFVGNKKFPRTGLLKRHLEKKLS